MFWFYVLTKIYVKMFSYLNESKVLTETSSLFFLSISLRHGKDTDDTLKKFCKKIQRIMSFFDKDHSSLKALISFYYPLVVALSKNQIPIILVV